MANKQEISEVLKQLRASNEGHENIKRAINSFNQLYNQNNKKLGIPSRKKIHAEFFYQTVSFNSGTAFCKPPTIDTCLEVFAIKNPGQYHYYTLMDSKEDDDLLVCGIPLFSQYPDSLDFDPWLPEQQFLEVFSDFIPLTMRNIFLFLKHTSNNHELEKRAPAEFATWLNKNPLWFQDFPRSFYGETSRKHISWLQNIPNWFHTYPQLHISHYDTIYTRLHKQKLCFNHACYTFPYIITELDVYTKEYVIGTYCFCTNMDGTVNEELTCTLPFPFTH